MATILKNCRNCKQQFMADTREHNRGNANFCGRSCSAQYNWKHVPPPVPNLTCARCNIKFYRAPSKLVYSKSGLHFCTRLCKDLAQRIGGITEIQPSHYGAGTGIWTYRDKAFDAYEHECANCGYNDHKAALDVHHINHDRSDNRIENLVILCVMCHRLIHRGIDI